MPRPEPLEQRADLTQEQVEAVPAQIKERSQVIAVDFKRRGRAAMAGATPRETAQLTQLEQDLDLSQQQLYRELEASRQRLHAAREASEKIQFWDRQGLKDSKQELEAAEQEFQGLMAEHGETQAARMVGKRIERAGLERAVHKKKTLLGRLSERLRGDKYSALVQEYEAEDRLQEVVDQYSEASAEVIADNIELAIKELGALTDERAAAEHGETAKLYKLYKKLGEANLQSALHRLGVEWEPTSWRGKLLAKGVNARLAVNMALLGGAFVAGASGLGTTALALFISKRVMSGAAGAVGTFDIATMFRGRKLNKELARRMDKEGPENFTDRELNEYIAQMEANSVVSGRRITGDALYQRLQNERGARLAQPREGLEAMAEAEQAAEQISKELAEMMAQADSRFQKYEALDRAAQERFKVYGAAVGVAFGSAAHVRMLKGALDLMVGTAFAAETGAELMTMEAVSGLDFTEAKAGLAAMIDAEGTSLLGDMNALQVESGTLIKNGDVIGFQGADGQILEIRSPDHLARVPGMEALLERAGVEVPDPAVEPSAAAEPPVDSSGREMSPEQAEGIGGNTSDITALPDAAGPPEPVASPRVLRVDSLSEMNTSEMLRVDQLEFKADGREFTFVKDGDGYLLTRADDGFRGVGPGVAKPDYVDIAKAHTGRASSSFRIGLQMDMSRYSDMRMVAQQMRDSGIDGSPQYADLLDQIAAEEARLTETYGPVLLDEADLAVEATAEAVPEPDPIVAHLTLEDGTFSESGAPGVEIMEHDTINVTSEYGDFIITRQGEGYQFIFAEGDTQQFTPGLARENFIEVAKDFSGRGSSGFSFGLRTSFGRLDQLLRANVAMEKAGLAGTPIHAALTEEMQNHLDYMARTYGDVFDDNMMHRPDIPDGLRTPSGAPLVEPTLADIPGGRAVERATELQSRGKEPTGLYEEEWDKAARKIRNPLSPGRAWSGFARGVRGLDDRFNRALDVGVYRAQAGLDRALDPEGGGPPLPPDRETLPDWDPADDRQIRKAARQAMRADRLGERQEAIQSARNLADAQAEVFAIPENPDPAVVDAFKANGTVKGDGVTAVFEHKRGQVFEIQLTEMAPKEESINLLGDDYQDVIKRAMDAQTHRSLSRLEIRPIIAEVENDTQVLASLLRLKKVMIKNGLTETDQFEYLEKAIGIQAKEVSEYGHVLWDDPDYGKVSAQQVRSRVVQTVGSTRVSR